MSHQQKRFCPASMDGRCPRRPTDGRCDGTSPEPDRGKDDRDRPECGWPVGQCLAADPTRLASSLSGWLQPADIDDLVQETLIRALTRPMEFRGRQSAFAWLRRLLRNLAIDHIRHERAERRARAGLARDCLVQRATTNEIEDLCVNQEILALLDEIQPTYADILRRVDIEDASIDEVARALRLTKGNVRVRLHRARATIRKRWTERR